jgi:hypothetical protein
MSVKMIRALIVVMMLTNCAGYRVKRGANSLFYNENISSISVPMFINKSSFPHVSAPMTREVVRVLSTVKGLTLYASDNPKADALLVGIIQSPQREADYLEKSSSNILTGGTLKESIGDRSEFFVPTSTQYRLSVRYFLIKKPTKVMLEALSSSIIDKLEVESLVSDSRIVFNKTLNFRGAYNRELADTIGPDSGGTVNYTKTRKYFETSLNSLAEQAAKDLKDLILSVF